MKQITLVLFLIFALQLAKAQSLLDIISNSNENYFEKIAYIEDNKSPLLDSASDYELKRYERWLSFWDSRVDEKGKAKLQNTS